MFLDLSQILVGEDLTGAVIAGGTQGKFGGLEGDVFCLQGGLQNLQGCGDDFLTDAITRDDCNVDLFHTSILVAGALRRRSVHIAAHIWVDGHGWGGVATFRMVFLPLAVE